MKKVLKNRKGFTLVELLAVIVVLAVIMVIATQTITGVIAGSRGDSYVSTVKMIAKGAETACTTDNDLSKTNLYVAYGDADVTIEKDKETVIIKPKEGGKFENMDVSKLSALTADGYSVSGTTVTYTASCKAKN